MSLCADRREERAHTHTHSQALSCPHALPLESLEKGTNCEAGTTMTQRDAPGQAAVCAAVLRFNQPKSVAHVPVELGPGSLSIASCHPAAPPMLIYTEPALLNTHS